MDKISNLQKKLHILFLNSWYPSRVVPYNGDFIQRHAEAVATQHHVTAIHVTTDENCQERTEIVEENKNGVQTYIGYIKKQPNRLLKWFYFVKTYRKLIKMAGKIDVIHVNILYPVGMLALYLNWKRGIPYIITEHSTAYHLKKDSGFRKTVSKLICKSAGFICPVTDHLGRALQQNGYAGRYQKVPNVVDTDIFRSGKQEKTTEFTILHVSHLGDGHKNISGMLTGIAEFKTVVPKFKVILIGENGEQYQPLIHTLRLDKHVQILNQISHKEVATYMQISDVFVLFSHYENLPCVILEAFACGLPVITTDVGGIREYFPEDFGTIIPPNDIMALKNALEKYYRLGVKPDKAKMHAYAEKHFGKTAIANALTELYTKAKTD